MANVNLGKNEIVVQRLREEEEKAKIRMKEKIINMIPAQNENLDDMYLGTIQRVESDPKLEVNPEPEPKS